MTSTQTIKNSILENNFSKQDTSISLWQLNNFLESGNFSNKLELKNLVCKHRANSFITQYKASLSNGCFETDILFLENKTISAHGEELDTNLIFDDFLKSSFQKTAIWFDSKNINKLKNCELAFDWINKNQHRFLSALVESPTSSFENFNNHKWKNCIKKINNIENVEVAYYMSTSEIKKCSATNLDNKQKLKCNTFFSDTVEFLEWANINSITFDFAGYKAIKASNKLKNYKWHIWHVNSIKSFNKILTNNNIGIMLLTNNQFANNLN